MVPRRRLAPAHGQPYRQNPAPRRARAGRPGGAALGPTHQRQARWLAGRAHAIFAGVLGGVGGLVGRCDQ